MPDFARKILWSVVFLVQMLGVSGAARASAVCVHADGRAFVETVTELAACHAEQRAPDDEVPAASDKSCVDLVPAADATANTAKARTAARDVHPAPAALPAFLATLADVVRTPRATHVLERARPALSPEMLSLGSIVLLI